ncbi:hypothetical protein ACFLXD_04485 [Chloroflexota bacterium]
MDLPLISRILLYIIVVIFGLLAIIVFGWQINVLRGKSMKNPDGSVDDWRKQKLFYGIALADITMAIPLTLVGIVSIFLGWRIGYYLTGLASFWFLWTNAMTTITSLRFEKPKITLMWFIVFPFGAIIGLAYVVWTLVHFEAIFSA